MRDARGLEISGASAEAVGALDHFRDQMLSLGPDPIRVLSDVEAHPECGLLQAYGAVFHLYSLTAEGDAAAAALLNRARAAGTPNEREARWFVGIEAWLRHDYESAMGVMETITEHDPRDLLAAKVAEFHYFATGQHWQGRRFLTHMERIADANRDSSHFLAMHAFAHELSGHFDTARALAERAIELERITPWAHHALAHADVRQGRFDEGERVLRDLAPTWAQSGQPIRGHNAWHLALFTLAHLDHDETLRIFREQVSGLLPESVGEQVDAVSLLWRIELSGREVAAQEWSRIADHLEGRADEAFIPFVSAHEVYALTRAGRASAAERKVAAARRAADESTAERRRVWRDVGLALVDACAALAAGDAARCATLLDPVISRVGCVGGSDAQDDLFRQSHLVSLIRARRHDDARRTLDGQLRGREPSPLEESWARAI